MDPIYIIIALAVIAAVEIAVLAVSFVCFMLTFYHPRKKPKKDGEYDLPEGPAYKPFHEKMIAWQDLLRDLPHEEIEITSRDGLTLRGRYYEYAKGASLEILFHGYKGGSVRDLSGAVERCFKLKRNAIIVDQRAHGNSEGRVITFGVKEKFDCLDWIVFATERFGKDQKIIITGISMGAATVLMAAGETLPDNVVCVIADCPYSSARKMILKTIGEMHLPPKLLYPFVRLGGIIWGDFDPSPIEAVKRAKVPIMFIHGDSDGFIPCEMTLKMHKICPSPKILFIAKGADHGLAFPMDEAGYYKTVHEFDTVWNK